jgi:hypothetical protein
VTRIFKLASDRYTWGDPQAQQTCSALMQSGKTSEALAGGWWHRTCYKQFAHIGHHERARERYLDSQLCSK